VARETLSVATLLGSFEHSGPTATQSSVTFGGRGLKSLAILNFLMPIFRDSMTLDISDYITLKHLHVFSQLNVGRLRLKYDGTRTETTFRLSAKRTSPFKSAGASVLSTTGSRDLRMSGSNAGYTMFRGSVKSTGYTLHSSVSLSLPLPCVTVCHHISTGLYKRYSHAPVTGAEPTFQ
jgi:hypothetical protein